MSFVPMYDLESLNEQQRHEYVKNVCAHMGVPDNLNLVMLTYLDDGDGPRRLVAYSKRGAAEIIRSSKGISITSLKQEKVGGSIVWTVCAQDAGGRQEMSSGSKWIEGLQGQDLDDAIMTAQTRACRRVTLQFIGAGVLDESEVNPNQPVSVKNTTVIPVPSQSTVQPASAPGKDITEQQKATGRVNEPVKFKGTDIPLENIVPGKKEISPEEQEEFKKNQDKLRADAIAVLNAQAKPAETEAKPVSPRRGRRPRVDMGPSVPPPTKPAQAEPTPTPVPAPVTTVTTAEVKQAPTTPPPSKGKLSPEQVKPYRQRLFRLVNDQLEPAGFAPKEGIGNADKMRSFATMMFPEISNMNELTTEQWEKYLTALEGRVASQGAAATAKFIEDAIGI
jgi:hypothetical protein